MRKTWFPLLCALLLPLFIPGLGCSNKNMGDKMLKQVKKKPNDISVRLRAGDALIEEDRYEEALEQYDAAVKLVEKKPKENRKYYFKAWNNKGVALYQLGEQTGKPEYFRESIEIFKKMLEIPAKKRDSVLHSNIAHAYHGLGDFAKSAAMNRPAKDTVFL